MMFSTHNPCCYGAFYDVPCTADCPSRRAEADAIAWAAYSRAWADAMSGIVIFDDGPPVKYKQNPPLDWSES